MRLAYLLLILLPVLLLEASAAPDESNLREVVSTLASPEFKGRYPGTNGHLKAVAYINGKLSALGLHPEVTLEDAMLPSMPTMKNIIATYPGTRGTKNCVILTAHYDHIKSKKEVYFAGANDNASGVSVLLELARMVTSSKLQLPFNLLFTFPDQEEKYLSGSRKQVPDVLKRCDRILYNLTYDVVGAPFYNGMENHMLAMGSESSASFAKILSRLKTDLSLVVGGIFLIEPMKVPRSDYAIYRKEDIPYIFFTGGTPKEYHTEFDTEEKIDYGMISKLTQLSFDFLTESAIQSGLGWEFIKRPDYDLQHESESLAYLLQKMLSRPVANMLDEKAKKYYESRIKFLLNKKILKTKAILQGITIRLIKSIED